MAEAQRRGWDKLDVVLITGDAYVDHPSFGVAMVGRLLESLALRVGVIAMPQSDDDFRRLGRPTLFFGVTSGNLDSMIMRYTAAKKRRSDDAYLPGGQGEGRPKRATIAYCNRLRELFDSPPIILGGLEASLRRHAHYDYWDNRVRRSILLDCRADLLIYGMGETALRSVVSQLQAGKRLGDLRDIPGTALVINKEEAHALQESGGVVTLPSFEEVAKSKPAYARSSKQIHLNQNPHSAKRLLQRHANRYVCVNSPALPLSEKELDRLYALPFTRQPHPSYHEKIPAFEMIRFSVSAMRGCFGSCSFCALTVHQGRAIQSRSADSIITEVETITTLPGFTGSISDIGGPTANMYRMVCNDPKVEAVCRKLSCVHPEICARLVTDHEPQIALLQRARKVLGVKKVFIASGVRYDLANRSRRYIRELASHHVSGQLKVAPEHANPQTLRLMRKPSIESFDTFRATFAEESHRAGKEQYLVPYFIASHPGCGVEEQIDLALYLKRNNFRPRQVQDFIPAPLTLAGDMYYSGIEPMSGKRLFVARSEKERGFQRALMQYFKPENRRTLADGLIRAGRSDLVGFGRSALVGYDRSRKKGGNRRR